MLKAVVFDLDNTLIDFMGAKLASCEASIDAMIAAGMKMKKKNAMKLLFDLYKRYGIEYKQIFQKFLLKTTGRIDLEILSAGIVAYRKIQASYHMPYKGVAKVLGTLKRRGYKLAILSDAPALKAWLRLTEMGVQDYFDVVVTFNDTRKRKPHELPFRTVLKKLRLKPSEVLFIGDHPRRDVSGARRAGMKTALAVYGMQTELKKYAEKNKPDYVLHGIEDVLEITSSLRNG